MIRGLSHAAISTGDLERALAFYVGLLGFQKVDEFGWPEGTDAADQLTGLNNSAARCAVLKCGPVMMEIFEFTSPDAKEADPARPLHDRGIAHLGLDVVDIDGEYQRLKAAGVPFINEPMWAGEGVRAAYGRDPDGNIIELQEISPR